MADHDQRLKTLIREFLKEFIRLFFPEWFDRFDFESIEWLDKEIFLDPPRGETRTLDLVAKVPVRQVVESQRLGQPDSWVILIHIEAEGDDRITRLRPRMHDYYKGLRDRYHLPVWSLALYLRVGLDGVGWDVYEEFLWERRVLLFEYPYVGLPGLDAEQYVKGESLLGVALAALMRVPEARRAELKAEALLRIQRSGDNDARKFLLGEFVEAYLPLDEAQQERFEQLMVKEPYQEAQEMMKTSYEKGIEKGIEKSEQLVKEAQEMAQEMMKTSYEKGIEKGMQLVKEAQEMMKTSYEKGVEKGIEKGMQLVKEAQEMMKTSYEKSVEKGERLVLVRLFEKRFGPMSPRVKERVESWPAERLPELEAAWLEGKTPRELGLED